MAIAIAATSSAASLAREPGHDDRAAGHRGERGARPGRDLARRAEERVDDRAGGGGVEPVLQRHAGDAGVAEVLRHDQRGDRDPGREVAPQPAAVVARQPLHHRQDPGERHAPACADARSGSSPRWGDVPGAAGGRPSSMATVDVDRERVIRTLTFWLRPQFVLRVVNRFQKIVGFDRAVALASSALTAIIPLAIITSSLATSLGGKDTADRIIDRYGLTGGGAEAVQDIFSPSGTSTSLGLVGFAVLPGRAAQLHAGRAAAVRADVGAQAAERAQQPQRPVVDQRPDALHGPQRAAARVAGTWRARCHPDAGRGPAVVRVPDLERHGADARSGSSAGGSCRSASSARRCSPSTPWAPPSTCRTCSTPTRAATASSVRSSPLSPRSSA